MTRLILPVAVFGPLATGTDVQVLAEPAGGELSASAASRLEQLFYARWTRRDDPPQSCFAFLELDQRCWGAVKIEKLGEGAMGELLVAKALLLDEAALTQIAWQTPDLCRRLFTDRLQLPPPRSRVEPEVVELGARISVGATADFAVFAYELDHARTEKMMRPAQIVLPAGGDPLQALGGTWGELGAWAARVSYCSWARLDAQGTKGEKLKLDVVPVEPNALLSHRQALCGTTDVPVAWYVRREEECRIPAPARIARSEANAVSLAQHWWDRHGRKIVAAEGFGVIEPVFEQARENTYALPWLLAVMLKQGKLDREVKARLIDAFARDILHRSPTYADMAPPQSVVLGAILEGCLLFEVDAPTITYLGNAIRLAADDQAGLRAIQANLDAVSNRRRGFDPATMNQVANELHGVQHDPLKAQMLSLLWQGGEQQPASSRQPMRIWIENSGDGAVAQRRYELARDMIHEPQRADFMAQFARIWAQPLQERIVSNRLEGRAVEWLEALGDAFRACNAMGTAGRL